METFPAHKMIWAVRRAIIGTQTSMVIYTIENSSIHQFPVASLFSSEIKGDELIILDAENLAIFSDVMVSGSLPKTQLRSAMSPLNVPMTM